jgi:6-phosphofructokinase 1
LEKYVALSVLIMIQVIDRSFGFDTAVEEAQRAINAAHVEAGSFENGVGIVKLMGRHSGKLRHRQIQSLTTMSHIRPLHVLFYHLSNLLGIMDAGFIAMHATLASRDVDCCLIPESPFYLEGKGGLFEFIKRRLKENGHMVIVVAEGAGQDLLAKYLKSMNQQDASGNNLLQDVGLWISHQINVILDRKFRDNLILLTLLFPVFVISW